MPKHSNEDKVYWVERGAKEEVEFCKIAPRYGLRVRINPAKARDCYAPDLLVKRAGQNVEALAELKYQHEPFFKARDLYGVDSQYAVSFNRKDLQRYQDYYPNLDIYFWVTWLELSQQISGRFYSVKPMTGVWYAKLETIEKLAHEGVRHQYRNRVSDRRGNARDSFVLDLRELEELPLVGAQGSLWLAADPVEDFLILAAED